MRRGTGQGFECFTNGQGWEIANFFGGKRIDDFRFDSFGFNRILNGRPDTADHDDVVIVRCVITYCRLILRQNW